MPAPEMKTRLRRCGRAVLGRVDHAPLHRVTESAQGDRPRSHARVAFAGDRAGGKRSPSSEPRLVLFLREDSVEPAATGCLSYPPGPSRSSGCWPRNSPAHGKPPAGRRRDGCGLHRGDVRAHIIITSEARDVDLAGVLLACRLPLVAPPPEPSGPLQPRCGSLQRRANSSHHARNARGDGVAVCGSLQRHARGDSSKGRRPRTNHLPDERETGLEPATLSWEADTLP